MKWIDATDLKMWANRRDCQENLPYLVRKLIRATSDKLTSIKFPAGDSIANSGWDGILMTDNSTEFIPEGISLWEFGSNADPKGKADDDYETRSKNPLGFNPADSTFIFVTPRLWKNGEAWAKEKQAEGVWKEVKVLNAENLEEWIETAPAVGAWLAKHINKVPENGIQATDDFWEEWSSGMKFQLNSDIILLGRERQTEELRSLAASPTVIAVQALSRDEALAFIICSFEDDVVKEDFFSRSIIVDNIETFRQLVHHDKTLILIPRFDDAGVMNRAINHGHTVVAPIAADSAPNWSNLIKLPQVDREAFPASLMKSGMGREDAEKYSKESSRNITILRRQLEFTRTVPEWALPENVNDIIPALLTGRWDEDYEGDEDVIAEVAGMPYEDYRKRLNRWHNTPDAPVVRIGTTWRLVSPFDAWTYASKNISRNSFELLSIAVITILSNINPALKLLPNQRPFRDIRKEKEGFSTWMKEGIAQSLTLTSVLGDKLKFDLPENSDKWVYGIVSELLSTDDVLSWKSMVRQLSFIAEASPDAFLEAIEKHLGKEGSPIQKLFEEEPGFLHPVTYHTNLLWALEGLAWLPEYLLKSTLILARLAAIDPGGSISNRPINSLKEIFKTWHYQTLASFEERMDVLAYLTREQPAIMWTLLLSLLKPISNTHAFYTHKMRWRMFEISTEKIVSWKDVYDTYGRIIDILLSAYDNTEGKLSELIGISTQKFYPSDREKLLSFIESVTDRIEQKELKAWHSLRKILSKHRSHLGAKSSLSETELKRYEDIYNKLTPENSVQKSLWMFDERWPKFPDGFQESKISRQEKDTGIQNRRTESLQYIYTQVGLEKTIELSRNIKEKWILGITLAHVLNDEQEIDKLCLSINNNDIDLPLVQYFVTGKNNLFGLDYVLQLIVRLREMGLSDLTTSNLLLYLSQSKLLWLFLNSLGKEVSDNYWRIMAPYFYHLEAEEKVWALDKLIDAKRYLTAVETCYENIEQIPTATIIQILETAATKPSIETKQLDDYHVNHIFEVLDNKHDADTEKLFQLEWMYLGYLTSFNSINKPIKLHGEMSKNPDFFIEVLKYACSSDEDAEFQKEDIKLADEQVLNRTKRASDLLHSWKKIPGMDETGKIDYKELESWIETVRKAANECGRATSADFYIGTVLAHYPEKQAQAWPPEEICAIIENINSDTINRNYSAQVYNNRGFTSRDVFDGGDIEREKATYFHQIAATHRNKFPVVANIFERIAKGYEEQAKRNDDEAERDKLDY